MTAPVVANAPKTKLEISSRTDVYMIETNHWHEKALPLSWGGNVLFAN